jgi:hypothetical protein
MGRRCSRVGKRLADKNVKQRPSISPAPVRARKNHVKQFVNTSGTLNTGNIIMNRTKTLHHLITLLFCGASLTTLTGCVGVVGPGYAHAYVPVPDVVVFGGGGWYDHDAGRRGYESRGHFEHGGRR